MQTRSHWRAGLWLVVGAAVLGGGLWGVLERSLAEEKPATQEKPAGAVLELHARRMVETAAGSGEYRPRFETLAWEPKRTALVICDMWDLHWCAGATRRVGDMAPRMNDVVKAARARGVFIIHCPSDTMAFYENTPQRKRAQQAPVVESKVPLQRWCRIDKEKEGDLPIDDSDGGCDCVPQCKNYRAWKRQIAAIEILPEDAITDSAEAYYLLQQRGIENVIVMGVHTNMCVLGRPFSIRQMVSQGKQVVLMRDMTDTMYNPRKAPQVHHCTGTDLVVEHIEKHWCPTITSVDFLGGKPFRFKEDDRPDVAIIMSEDEYETARTLPAFARTQLGRDFRVNLIHAHPARPHELVGLETLEQADVLLLSMRRRALPQAQLDTIRRFIDAGRPVVALRTSSHAFTLRPGTPVPAGHAEWPTFDRDVLGCTYTGHHDNTRADAPRTLVRVAPAAEKTPLVAGLPTEEFPVRSWLYKSLPLAESVTVLLTGRVDDRQPHEPVAWTYRTPRGSRVFYTSLGHPDDFALPAFQRLLVNGLHWAADRPLPVQRAE